MKKNLHPSPMTPQQNLRIRAKRKSRPLHTALICGMCSTALFRGWLYAQFLGQNLLPRDTAPTIFVRDSAVAVEKFALAGRMERLHEWDKAADVYQDLLKNYADKVYPLPLPKESKFVPLQQYTSVSREALSHLVKWPAEALAIYRNRYESEAGALVDAAHDDPAQLHRVLSQYFVTDASRRSAMRLMDIDLENGDFSAAAIIGDQMLDQYPDLSDEQKPVFLYRTAIAHHLAGEDQQAQTLLGQLKEKYPQAHSAVRGQDMSLADSLAKELAGGADSKIQSYMPDTWPIVFGSPDRSRIPNVSNFGGAKLFSIEIPRQTIRGNSLQQRTELDRLIASQMSEGHLTGIFPVVDRGELFFQDNTHVYAVSLESGLPLTGWAQTYDGDRNGRSTTPNAWAMPVSHQSCLTVTDDSVLAIMGQLDLTSIEYTDRLGVRDSRLVCLDRETGAQKWVDSPKQLPAEISKVDLSGSPLVVGDTVFVQAHGGRGMQFEDFYVLAFNLADGKFKWSSFVASANATIEWWTGSDIGAVFGQSASHLAYSGGRVYALSNLGAVAAIDAYDGSVQWLNTYPRETPEYNRTFGMRGRGGFRGPAVIHNENYTKPWTANPVIVSQGKVFVMPDDGLYVDVYDAVTGTEVRRISRLQFDSADTMLGVVDEKLILNSDNKVFCVNWQKGQETIWETAALQRSGVPGGDSIQGRGFVTADSVIIPTQWQLYQISLSKGSITQTYPSGQAGNWGEEEGPGNVLVTQDRLIIAGPTSAGQMRVNVYTDVTMAMAKLDAAVAAAPDDPAPRLRYAEVMYAGGKNDVAIAKLDEAMQLVGAQANANNAAMRPNSVRDRIFNTAMTFAQKLAKENRPDQVEMVSGLYERAGVAASTPSQKVNYRLSRAQYAKQMKQLDVEIKIYQQILLDPELRNVVVSYADGAVVAAGDLSRRAIAEIIGRADATVYLPFEHAAEELLTTASKNISPEQLQAVAESYPNSTAASKALLAAADIYEAKGNPRAALTVLRQAGLWYPSGDDAPKIVEAMARNYLLLPDHLDVAIGRLTQTAVQQQRLTKALVLPDGRKIENVTFAEAATALRQYRNSLGGQKLTDIGFPVDQNAHGDPFLPEGANSAITDVESLLVPKAEFGRSDRVVTFSGTQGLRVYPIGSSTPVIVTKEPFVEIGHEPQACAWMGKTLVVWSNDTLAAFSEGNKPLLWKAAVRTLPSLELVSRPAVSTPDTPPPANQQQQAQNMGQMQIQIQGQGALIIRGNRFNGPAVVQIGPNGPILIQQNQLAPQLLQAPPRTATEQIVTSTVCVLSDRLIVGTTEGRLIAISSDGGRVLWQTRFADRAATHLLATDDFIVTRTVDESSSSVQITAYDADSGQAISRANFSAEAGSQNQPNNLALAPDGMLIVVTPSQILGKDLFQPGAVGSDSPTFATIRVSPTEGLQPFQNSVTPEHLRIMEDRFIVAGNEPNGSTFMRMYDLHTGALIKFSGQQGERVILDAKPTPGPFVLRPFGSYLYIVNQTVVRGINLNSTSEKSHAWNGPMGSGATLSVRDIVVTHNHLIVIGDPSPVRPLGLNLGAFASPYLQLFAYSRVVQASGMESGRLDFYPKLTEGTGVINCQLVDGGVYYLSGDHKLHYRQGAAAK